MTAEMVVFCAFAAMTSSLVEPMRMPPVEGPPKPASRPDRVSLWRYLRLFRSDILSAQPARLYRAWMAEFRTPFFRSYLCNDPALVALVLNGRSEDFPKSLRVAEGLRPLLGRSVFVTNGDEWKRQRRIIDPAFEGGRLRDAFAGIRAAGEAAVARMREGVVEIEAETSHVAADVIFRTLFSIPIGDRVAARVFEGFRAYQRAQPILNLAAFVPLPRWLPRAIWFWGPGTRSGTVPLSITCSITAQSSAVCARSRPKPRRSSGCWLLAAPSSRRCRPRPQTFCWPCRWPLCTR